MKKILKKTKHEIEEKKMKNKKQKKKNFTLSLCLIIYILRELILMPPSYFLFVF